MTEKEIIFNPYKLFVGSFLPNILLQYKELTPGAKLCWARLVQYAREEEIYNPKEEVLAEELGMSIRAIQRYIKELLDKGFIFYESGQYYFLYHSCFITLMPATFDAPLQRKKEEEKEKEKEERSKEERDREKEKENKENKNFVFISSAPEGTLRKGGGKEPSCSTKESRLIAIDQSTKLRLFKPEPVVKPNIRVPKTIQVYINIWREGGLKQPACNTAAFQKDVQTLKRMVRGVFFNEQDTPECNSFANTKLDLSTWENAIGNFTKTVFDVEYHPADKKYIKGLYLHQFVYNPYYRGEGKSLFIYHLTFLPKRIIERVKDIVPILTQLIMKKYKEKVMNTDEEINWSTKELNTFVEASNRLTKYIEDNKKRIVNYNQVALPIFERANLLFKALLSYNKPTKVTPFYLASDIMFQRQLPGYLKENDLLYE